MTGLLLRRVAQTLPLIVGLAVLTFLLVHLAPGDPATYLLGDTGASASQVADLRARLGLDRPLPEQLLLYLGSLAQGDLGRSYYFSQPVLDVLLARIPATLLLMGAQLIVSVIAGVGLGVLAATHWNGRIDRVVSVFSVFGYSVPVFWTGLLAILLFAVQLQILPAQGLSSVRDDHVGFGLIADVGSHLILPTLTLATVHMALIARVTRAGMIDVLTREYIAVARSKGLAERTVIWRHALPNALLPIVTVVGLYVGQMLAGTIVVETVFGWPGMGRLMFESIARRDYPVILGGFMLVAIGVTVANFITDVVYGIVDPRVRLRSRAG